MKKTRKLIPALVMLLVSAIMLSTASYAWFASNDTVAVSGMHVKVKSTAKFLEISEKSDVDFGKSVKFDDDALADIELIHAQVADTENSATLVWKLGESKEYDQVGNLKDGTVEVSAEYALMKTLYVRMDPNSTDALENLRIKKDSVTVKDKEGNAPADPLAKALRLLIVCKDNEDNILGIQVWSNGDTPSITTYNGTSNTDEYLAPSVELNKEYTLKTYLFFDGQDENATTKNTDNLQELVVGFSLTAGPEITP